MPEINALLDSGGNNITTNGNKSTLQSADFFIKQRKDCKKKQNKKL